MKNVPVKPLSKLRYKLGWYRVHTLLVWGEKRFFINRGISSMDNHKQKLKDLNIRMQNNCIDLKIFLINYCGIFNEDLFTKKLKHKDIKELLPQLKRVSFEYLISDIRLLYNGEIIAVRDSYGEVLPYINPKVNMQNLDYSQVEYDLNEQSMTKEKLNNIQYENLSIEELILLCKRLKKYKRIQEYRIVSKYLKGKIQEYGYCKVKQYKREKYKIIG